MIRVRVGRCVRVCVLEPHMSACVFFFWLCLLLLLTATDTTTMRVWTAAASMFGNDVCVVCVLRVRTATVQQQSHSKFVWTTSMRVLPLHMYALCDVCAMLREHVACETTTYCCTSVIMLKVNNTTYFEVVISRYRSSC